MVNSIPLYEVFPAEKHGRPSYCLKKGTLCVLGFEVRAKCVWIHCRCAHGGGIVRKQHLVRKKLRKR